MAKKKKLFGIKENKMRDDSKTIDFYNDILEMDTNFIEASEKRLKMVIDLKGPDFKTVPSCFSGISQNYFHRFYLNYTMGKKYEELLPDDIKYVENGLKGCNGNVYGDLESIIYTAIIFNLHNYEVSIKNCILSFSNYQDNFMEKLYQLLDNSYTITTDKLFWPKECTPLLDIIQLAENNKESAVENLKEFLDKKWFKTLHDGLITQNGCYRGFWCLEAAALVRALKLDDTELKECKYYPYDMAHFCDK